MKRAEKALERAEKARVVSEAAKQAHDASCELVAREIGVLDGLNDRHSNFQPVRAESRDLLAWLEGWREGQRRLKKQRRLKEQK